MTVEGPRFLRVTQPSSCRVRGPGRGRTRGTPGEARRGPFRDGPETGTHRLWRTYPRGERLTTALVCRVSDPREDPEPSGFPELIGPLYPKFQVCLPVHPLSPSRPRGVEGEEGRQSCPKPPGMSRTGSPGPVSVRPSPVPQGVVEGDESPSQTVKVGVPTRGTTPCPRTPRVPRLRTSAGVE